MTSLRGALPFCLLLLAGPLAADESLGLSEQGVVVLRNGQVLQGEIERLGDHYVVAMTAGAKVHLPAADVALHCKNLEEAYQKKRQYITPDNAQQHLDLAEWCLREGLKRQAAQQLSAAMAVDPAEPRIAPFEQRLRDSLTPLPVAKVSSNVAAPAPADELEDAMRSVPASAIERFTSNVQPLLLNRCSTSSCHGIASKSSFKLLRPAAGTTLTRRYTQRNLQAVLQIVDRAAPEASPLLTAPRGVHGTSSTPVFGQREERQFEQLVQWVKQATDVPRTRQIVNVSPAEPRPIQVADAHAMRTYMKPAMALNGAALNQSKQESDFPADSTPKRPAPTQPQSPPPPAPKLRPEDPFDPELFNRRFHSESD